MNYFWEIIIRPVLEALEPKILVEIGSDYGLNTRKLLEFCERHGAKLYVIDPLPKYDVAAWQERYGEHLVFHRALSLDALPAIDRFDVVLIDGDHNWYTVFNELKLIEERCKASSHPFPLVMLHDVGWPYGRRDLYYDPDNIPDKYLKPYEKKGIRPGSVNLVEDGGLNQDFNNAVSENGPQNGVLTAVEDFLRETEQALELVKVSGLHGLGMLIPLQLKKQNAQLAQFFEVLELSPTINRYIEMLEGARLETEIRWEELRTAYERLKDRDKKLKAKNERVVSQNRRLKQRLNEIESSRSWRSLSKLLRIKEKVLGR